MGKSFPEKWNPPTKEPFGEKIKGAVQPPPPIRVAIEDAIRRLRIQSAKLEQMYRKLAERDRRLFNRIVEAYVRGDLQRAKIIATEVANIRKVVKVILSSKNALESVILRLETYLMVGDALTYVGPAAKVVSTIGRHIKKIIPEAEQEFAYIGEILNEVIMQTLPEGVSGSEPLVDEEAYQILREAEKLAQLQESEKTELEKEYTGESSLLSD